MKIICIRRHSCTGVGTGEGGHVPTLHLRPPQVLSLCHVHSICSVLQIKNCVPPQSKSLSYASELIRRLELSAKHILPMSITSNEIVGNIHKVKAVGAIHNN